MRKPKRLVNWHPIGLRRNDTVVMLSGDDKGKQGRVVRVISRRNQVVVEGVNMVVKHRRAARQRTAAQIQTGRIDMPAPVDRAKVMLVCPRCGKPTRATMTQREQQRVRACKTCKEIIDAS